MDSMGNDVPAPGYMALPDKSGWIMTADFMTITVFYNPAGPLGFRWAFDEKAWGFDLRGFAAQQQFPAFPAAAVQMPAAAAAAAPVAAAESGAAAAAQQQPPAAAGMPAAAAAAAPVVAAAQGDEEGKAGKDSGSPASAGDAPRTQQVRPPPLLASSC